MLPAGRSEASAPCLQPLAQYLGNGIADNGLVLMQHPMLRSPADIGCKAMAVALRRS
jgi:hypothetical protein